MPRRVVAIVNPTAGRGLARRLLDDLAALLGGRGVQFEAAMTYRPGQATQLAAAASRYADLLMVVGGDGTANEVLQAASVDGPAILVVPAGTENVLAKELGLSRKITRIWQTLTEGLAVDFDLGLLGDRRFSMLVSAGFDAVVVHDLHAGRSGPITHLSYVEPTLRWLRRYDWPEIAVCADGRELFAGRGMVFVCNISRYALGLRICRAARPIDGLLDVCAVPCDGRMDLIRWAGLFALRLHRRTGRIRQCRASSVRIEAAGEVPVELDGDPAGFTPAEIGVVPAAARLMCHRSALKRLTGNAE